jgi:hypothetical protein
MLAEFDFSQLSRQPLCATSGAVRDEELSPFQNAGAARRKSQDCTQNTQSLNVAFQCLESKITAQMSYEKGRKW